MKERVVLFGRDRSLVGILTEPGEAADKTLPAVLLLNAGFIHRVGPNRLHVKLARRLSELGFRVLRFDFSGVGDSLPSRAAIPFDQRALDETAEAMDFLQRTCGTSGFVPMGICSGADIGFAVAQRDERVVGAVLVNGGFIGDVSEELLREAQMRTASRYYRRRIWDLESWARLLRGKSNLRAVGRAAARFFSRPPASPAAAPPSTPELLGLHRLKERAVDLLVVCSEGSVTTDLLELSLGIDKLAAFENVRLEEIANSDHVFTPLWAQTRLIDVVCGWSTGVFKNRERDPV